MSKRAKVGRSSERYRKIQKLSRSKKALWNEFARLLPKADLGYNPAENRRWMIKKERRQGQVLRIFVDLKTGTILGPWDMVLLVSPKDINPRRQISNIKKLIAAQSSIQTPR